VSITLATTLISLPIAWWQHTRALHVGLSTQSATAWFRDLALSWLIDAATTALILVLVVGFARRWPRRWPLPIAACVAAATLALSMAYPLLIEPLFNRFTPLPQGPLRSAITKLAERQGVRIREVLVADASRRTTALNAYVSGIGSTRRVVLYDTLVKDLPPDQAEVVVAHELAHARNHDVAWGTALGAVGSIAGVGLLGLLLSRRWLLARSCAHGSGDPRVVPLVIFLISAGSLAVSPAQNLVSRAMETRADVESLQATSDFEGFRRMQATLCDKSWCDPAPPALAQFWFGSHPTTQERIGLANDLEGE
jgi:STE24 endopeptidase